MVPALVLLLPVVEVSPRGKWQRNDRPAWAGIESWLGRRVEPSYPVQQLMLRYLRAFGPASTADVQTGRGSPGFSRW